MYTRLRQRLLQLHGEHHQRLEELARGLRKQVEQVDHRGGDLEVLGRRARLLRGLAGSLLLCVRLQPAAQVLQKLLAERGVEPVGEQLQQTL